MAQRQWLNRRVLSSFATGVMYAFTILFGVSDIIIEYFVSDELSELFWYKFYVYSVILAILICLDTLIYEIIGLSDYVSGTDEKLSDEEINTANEELEKEERASFELEALRRFKIGEISEAALIELIKDESTSS